MKKFIFVLCLVVAVLVIIVFVSQLLAHTPKITDENGNEVKGSIAELRKIKVNGRNEWLSIRGYSKDAPILLYLAGGPGGSQMSGTRFELHEMEKHFIMVGWDQPGSGKSYGCMNRKELTVDTYIEDGLAVTEYLKETFHQDKIYLMGESWGSLLGIFLITKKPDYYAGFIGTGQMVDIEETEKIDYHYALRAAREAGNDKLVKTLTTQGEPLYLEGNIALQSANYLNYLNSCMGAIPEVYGGYPIGKYMTASEYGILDIARYGLGLMNTFNVVYPQLYHVNLRETHTKVDVPVFFFEGRYDLNAPTSLVEEYYDLLEAPKKELIWFEHSAHCQWTSEPELFVSETLRVFEQ